MWSSRSPLSLSRPSAVKDFEMVLLCTEISIELDIGESAC